MAAGMRIVCRLLLASLALSGCAAVRTPHDEWRHGTRPATATPADGCGSHFAQVHAAAADGDRVLADELADYQQLVEQALVHRAKTVEIGTRLRQQSEPLSGADLQTLNQGLVAHLALREALMGVAERHECWLSLPTEQIATLTPRQRLEGVMLSLSAALVLYDNYLLAVSLFEEEPKLRRLLNGADAGYGIGGQNLNGVADAYYSVENRARVRTAIAFYERELAALTADAMEEKRLGYLAGLIEQSPSYHTTRAPSTATLGRQVRMLEAVTGDHLAALTSNGVNLFSMLFGNTVGLVETRKGKLYGLETVRSEIAQRLRAGDILLEKTPFRLTDTLIPGHWGHAALWIGTEPELRELGIWDHPLVASHHDRIRTGAGVVEALRPGVQINPLARFMNVDDLVVLRGREMGDQERAAIVLESLRQIGKEYDFNFDVETTDRIVCSELIYLTYNGIEWPTRKALGRATISPDHIAAKALHGGPLEVVLLYHDGRQVIDQPEEHLALLLQGKTRMATARGAD